jgi:hypothetical protein
VSEPADESPYPGPRPFDREDRALFFGREAETRELVSLVVAHQVVLLYAASGAGKTSLLNAGVIPVLERDEGFEVLPRIRIRATTDEGPAEAAENAYAYAALSNLSKDLGIELDEERLLSLTLAEFLAEREPLRDDQGFPAPRVAIFDQFEELFTVYPKFWAQRRAFVRQIADLLELEPPVRVVLVMREDHVAELAPYTPLLPDGFRIRLRIEGLRREPALRAVTGPLRDTSREFAPGVADALVGDLLKERIERGPVEPQRDGAGIAKRFTARLRHGRSPDALPSEVIEGEFAEPVQLQVVCRALWAELPADAHVITHKHLQGFGNVDQVLGRFYDNAVRAALRATRVDEGPARLRGPLRPVWRAINAVHPTEGQLRARIEEAFITPLGTRGMEYRGPSAVGGIPNSAVAVLDRRRLIRPESRAGGRWYELTHDRLIEPIQTSNRRYRERQRRIAVGASLAAALVLAAVAASWAIAHPSGAKLAPPPAAGVNVLPEDAGLLVASRSARLDFGRQPVDGDARQTIVLTSGSRTMRITGAEIRSEDFQFFAGCNIPGTLPAKGKCRITVLFAPLSPGEKSSVLRFTRMGGGPLQVALTGTGVGK